MKTTTPHPIPHRYHRAWARHCDTCGHRELSTLLLTIHIACPNGCGTMDQAAQHAAPDVETVTEWLTCGIDAVCPTHRAEVAR